MEFLEQLLDNIGHVLGALQRIASLEEGIQLASPCDQILQQLPVVVAEAIKETAKLRDVSRVGHVSEGKPFVAVWAEANRVNGVAEGVGMMGSTNLSVSRRTCGRGGWHG